MSEQDRTTEAAEAAQRAAEAVQRVQQAAEAAETEQPAAEEPAAKTAGQTVNPEEQAAKGKKKKKEKVKKSLGMEILSWVWTILIAFAVAMVVRAVIFEPVRVDGHSMDDTLDDKEIMLVSKFDYNSVWLCFPWQNNEDKQNAPRITLFGNPKQFDVVICRYPGRGDTNFVKRVIGMPGDTVELENGQLSVNGIAYNEPYVNDEYRTGNLNEFSTFKVPAKGDPFVYKDGRLYVNGTAWRWSDSRLSGTAENGKKLQYYYDFTNSKPVIKLDGKAIESMDELETISGVEFKLDEDYYFVMGDHRNNSNDSRSQGPIERSMIIGHVRQVVYPFGKWRGVPNGLEVK